MFCLVKILIVILSRSLIFWWSIIIIIREGCKNKKNTPNCFNINYMFFRVLVLINERKFIENFFKFEDYIQIKNVLLHCCCAMISYLWEFMTKVVRLGSDFGVKKYFGSSIVCAVCNNSSLWSYRYILCARCFRSYKFFHKKIYSFILIWIIKSFVITYKFWTKYLNIKWVSINKKKINFQICDFVCCVIEIDEEKPL